MFVAIINRTMYVNAVRMLLKFIFVNQIKSIKQSDTKRGRRLICPHKRALQMNGQDSFSARKSY